MASFNSLFLLLVLFSIVEMFSPAFVLLITTYFVFLIVSFIVCYTHTSLLSFLVFAVQVIIGIFFSTCSLLVFFVSFEFSLLPIALLVLFFGYQPEKIQSSLWLLFYTVLCSSPLLYFTLLNPYYLFTSFTGPSSISVTIASLAFIVKSPIYTLHSWLPKAHVEAPLPASMLLAGVILKLGGYGLIVLSVSPCLYSLLFVLLSLRGGIVCSLLCFRCWDMKSIVAYSSIVHISSVTLGALSRYEVGVWVRLGMIFGHSLISPLLFALSNEVYQASGSRCFILIHSSCSCTRLLLSLSLFSGLNIGLPPFINFWVEVGLFCVMCSWFMLSGLFLAATAFLTFLYSMSFYVFSVGGPSGPGFGHRFYQQNGLPSLIFCLLSPLCSSLFLTWG